VIQLQLDRRSQIPLYHQIVQAVKWRIGTGSLEPGELLPSVREAGKQWGVNYHTVRRAYRELASEGWLDSIQGSGTQVSAVAPDRVSTHDGELHLWLTQVVATGRLLYGLSAVEIATRLREHSRALRVVMVECNMHQSGFLAEQLEAAWHVEVVPWSLDNPEEPPHLPIIGTYFHHVEMKARWPHREADMAFVALRLDPDFKERVQSVAAEHATEKLRLLERDPATAIEMAASVAGQLPARFLVQPEVGNPKVVLRSLASDELLLVAPRLWDQLDAATQEDKRVLDVRYLADPVDLQRVWKNLIATSFDPLSAA
jgi:GntR family transcriptional regulator